MIENPKWDGKGRRLTQLNESGCGGVWHKQGRGLHKAIRGTRGIFAVTSVALEKKRGLGQKKTSTCRLVTVTTTRLFTLCVGSNTVLLLKDDLEWCFVCRLGPKVPVNNKF